MIERCDRCNSQAFVQVLLYSSRELFFCGHHYAEHKTALESIALRIIDERETINLKPSPSGVPNIKEKL